MSSAARFNLLRDHIAYLRVPLLLLLVLQAFADERGIPFLETSAKSATNVEKAFLTMAAEIKNRMASVPQQDEGAKGTVTVAKGESVKAAGGGGCC